MNNIRAAGLGLMMSCLASSSALACFDPSSQSSVFFGSVPPELASPVVASVRVLKVLDPLFGDASYFGHARVEKLIRGTIKGNVIKLVANPTSSCQQPFRVGDAGIVIGSVSYGGDLPEFAALAESMSQRMLREKGGTP
jgi:hypothetical protein